MLVDVIDTDTVEDFVSYVKHADHKVPRPGHGFLWRGVSDSTYKLTPTAHREAAKDYYSKLYKQAYPSYGYEQGSAEWIALADFYARANEQTLPLPSIPEAWHQLLVGGSGSRFFSHKYLTEFQQQGWPQEAIMSTLGLAQHYGMPTRLLDWTSDARVAYYFAATGGLRRLKANSSDKGRIAVWFMSDVQLRMTALISPGTGKPRLTPSDTTDPGCRIHVIDAPYSGNPNLAAQKGRFTCVSVDAKHPVLNYLHTLDEVLEYFLCVRPIKDDDSKMSEASSALTRILKITLPTSKCMNLLYWLLNQGYDAARMFPGYGGCVQANLERLKCDEFMKTL